MASPKKLFLFINRLDSLKYVFSSFSTACAIASEREPVSFPDLKSFVSIDETSVTVVIDSKEHDKAWANKIMRSVQEEFENSMSISVKCQK